MDTIAQALLAASLLLDDGSLEEARAERYSGWNDDLGVAILSGGETLAGLEARVASAGIDPDPRSGNQEFLENIVNRAIWQSQN